MTIVITGSNVGLGKEAARHYARLGASRLILAVRNLDKGHEAKRDIAASTGCAENVIQVWKLDMSKYDSVQSFAARINDELPRVDIFHANAGVACGNYRMAEDNEESITINVVATFLLVALVMPKLKATAAEFQVRPTLSITTSGVHRFTKLPQKAATEIFPAVNDKATAEKYWDEQYPVSKLLGVLALRSIAEKYPAKTYPVVLNLVDPGLCHSEREFYTCIPSSSTKKI
jgi:NAD(P)-dependent dehydrogenase (short-subunit alcohol dehydrogenase family)